MKNEERKQSTFQPARDNAVVLFQIYNLNEALKRHLKDRIERS